LGKCLLRPGEVSGLQCLADGGEVLLTLADLEWIAVGEWPMLAQILDGGEFLLSTGEVTRLERLAKFLQIRAALLKVRLQLMINRTGGNGCG